MDPLKPKSFTHEVKTLFLTFSTLDEDLWNFLPFFLARSYLKVSHTSVGLYAVLVWVKIGNCLFSQDMEAKRIIYSYICKRRRFYVCMCPNTFMMQ